MPELLGTLNKDNIGTGSRSPGDLCSAQHCKCCYCERNNFEASYNDVEHYRPKLRADRGPGLRSMDTGGSHGLGRT